MDFLADVEADVYVFFNAVRKAVLGEVVVDKTLDMAVSVAPAFRADSALLVLELFLELAIYIMQLV